MPVTMSSTWQRPLLLWAATSSLVFGSQTCIAFAPDGTATSTACEPGEVLWIARVHTCVCRIGCTVYGTAASACHEHVQCACVLRTTLPFLVRVLKCVQRVILWCGHNRQGKSTSCVSCVNINQLLNQPLIRIHYIICRVHFTQHTGVT